MGKNTGSNTRKGQVKERSQTFNDKTKLYVKRDNTTGKFIGSKKTPFKGVKKDERAKVNYKKKD